MVSLIFVGMLCPACGSAACLRVSSVICSTDLPNQKSTAALMREVFALDDEDISDRPGESEHSCSDERHRRDGEYRL